MFDDPRFALPASMTLRWSLVSRPLRARFGISRGAKRYATSLLVELSDAGYLGRGESVPYARYGETLKAVCDRMRGLAGGQVDAAASLAALEGGCVREALDSARWDFLCKRHGRRIDKLLGITLPSQLATCYTVSLDEPSAMAAQARSLSSYGTLKLKLGGNELDLERIEAVAKARPKARLIADANEGWDPASWPSLGARAAKAGLSLLEQPFPADQDACLGQSPRPLPCFADESVHGIEDLPALVGRYDGINIKLGKCGGLDRAFALMQRAKELGLSVMVGCMVGSSRSIAPALLLAASADIIDLDAHLWLTHDVPHALRMKGEHIQCPWPAQLWG